MTGDPLSDILNHLGARCVLAGGFTAGGGWAIRFPRPDAIKFGVIAEGACRMRMDGLETPLPLAAGDVYFLKGDRPFDLFTEPGLPPDDAREVFSRAEGSMAQMGAGSDLLYLGGHVVLDERQRALLLNELPPLIHIAGGSDRAAGLQWLVRELVDEAHLKRAGAELSTGHLAQLLFVRVLRAWLDDARQAGAGWLRGLGDARIAPALALMHSDPGRSWQLAELARAVGMSRSVFAVRFKSVVGMAPLGYLAHWRMRLAAQALERGTEPVSQIAETLGYSSVSAFSNAFKRTTGAAPKRFRTAALQVADN